MRLRPTLRRLLDFGQKLKGLGEVYTMVKPLGVMKLTIICGFSLFYAWYLVAFFGLFMFQPAEPDFATFHMGQVLFFAGSVLATVFILHMFKRADSVAIGHTRFLYLASLIPGSALPACVIAYELGITPPLAVFYICCFLAGASIAFGFMLWEDLSKHGYLDRGVLSHGIIFCAGGVLFLLCSQMLTELQNAVAAELFLCASTMLFAYIAPHDEAIESKPVKPVREFFAAVWHLDVVVAVINVAFGYAFMLLYQQDNAELLMAMTVAIFADLVFSAAFGRGKWLMFAGAARVCAAIVSCALILFACPDALTGNFALCVIVAMWFIFRTMNGGSLTDLANRHDFSALYAATRGKMPANVGFTVGLLVGVWAIAFEVDIVANLYIPLALVAAFILSALFLLPFDSESAMPGYKTLALVQMHESPDASMRARCEEATRMYKLSPRESETLAFLMKGRNAKHVAEKLVISESTAKTHISNIYRKLGVHSQQELLDTLDGIG